MKIIVKIVYCCKSFTLKKNVNVLIVHQIAFVVAQLRSRRKFQRDDVSIRLLFSFSFFCVNLRNVVVLVGVVLVPLHIVSVDERFNSLLEIWRFNRKLELVVEFGDEEIVRQRFTHFHDPDDGCVNLVLTILEDSFLRRLLLLRRFLQLNLIYFDVVQLKKKENTFLILM